MFNSEYFSQSTTSGAFCNKSQCGSGNNFGNIRSRVPEGRVKTNKQTNKLQVHGKSYFWTKFFLQPPETQKTSN
jgi:hypothetical protein